MIKARNEVTEYLYNVACSHIFFKNLFFLNRGANKGTSSPGVIHYGLKESESGYYSSSSDNDHINSYTNVNQERRKNSLGKGGAKFCHECGTKYPLSEAKFCCECGVKRMALT